MGRLAGNGSVGDTVVDADGCWAMLKPAEIVASIRATARLQRGVCMGRIFHRKHRPSNWKIRTGS
jgi:hypothetical protein